MSKFQSHFKKLLSFLMSVLVIAELLYLPAFAVTGEVTDSNESSAVQNSGSMQHMAEDSTFELVNANVQISDDYHSETAYISEVEASRFDREAPSGRELVVYAASSTVGDPMVYYTQKWLNQEYGSVPGFGSVPVNGKTGWDTVYGLLRALQYELGITSLTNSFGPTTSALYEANPLQRQDGVTNRKFAILQGALWCKGYSPGYYIREEADGTIVFDEVFNTNVENAVIQLKRDAGFANPNGVVTLNVMKALMSMDSFQLLPSSYGSDANVRAFQQKLNRKYEAYTGLNPCDGVYGRNTNKALVYALQAVEGLPVGVANGNFGETTKLCCPEIPYARNSTAARRYPGTSSGALYTNDQISAFTELLQFALYVNGFGNGSIDGIFGSSTRQALKDFQKQYAIPVTGKADKGTWMSLFISCGDTSRPALAADCATILTPAKAQTLYNNGYRYIGRYLTGTYNGGISKAITKEEAQIIFNAGLNFFPIYQTSARSNAYFNEAQGTADAESAIAAASALGIPRDTIIYFAVDYDAMDSEITSYVIPYFRKVQERMAKSIYRTGIYGTRNACSRVSALGYACSSFVGDMSTGWSGNLGFSMPDNWAFDQFKTISLGSGDGFIEIDKNGFSGRDHGVSKLGIEIDPYPDYSISLTAGKGGKVEGAGRYENGSLASIIATPDVGYIFDGWYENGNIIHAADSTYVLTVKSDRTLEARFKPNDLAITDIEVFGSMKQGDSLTFTAATTGGNQPLQWSFYIYAGETTYYSDADSPVDFFEWTPLSAGNYTVVAYCTDSTGYRVEFSTTFAVLNPYVISAVLINPQSAYIVNEGIIRVRVTTTMDINYLDLYNTNGGKIGVSKTRTVVTNDAGESVLQWDISFTVGTKGERTLLVYAGTNTPTVDSGFTVQFTAIDKPIDTLEITSIRAPKSAVKNQPFEFEIVSTKKIPNLSIRNENNGKMGSTKVSETTNTNGSVSIVIRMSVGTAGIGRVFKIFSGETQLGQFVIDITEKPVEMGVIELIAPDSAPRNVLFQISIVTTQDFTKLYIRNETGGNIGISILSKVRNADASYMTIVRLAIGTAGNGRVLSIYNQETKLAEFRIDII